MRTITNPWFVSYWNELSFDCLERLGCEFGDLPLSFALPWGWSILRIEGTHCNARAVNSVLKRDKAKKAKQQSEHSDMEAKTAVADFGGDIQVVESKGEESPYWRKMREEYGSG